MVGALEQFLVQKEAERRQAMLDALAREDRQIDHGVRRAQLVEQQRQAERQARVDQLEGLEISSPSHCSNCLKIKD
jgi:hypothetical protein